jgi:hypothetical protein
VSAGFSDAEGRFRLGNIPPGRFYIVAGALGQATYYPGSADRTGATVVTVERGSTMTLDFKLVIAVGGRVAGRIEPPPAPGSNEIAVLSGVKLEEVIETPVRPDGTFEFGHLPHDTYLLNIAPTPPGLNSLAFRLADEDVTSLRFARPETRLVSGRVVVDRGPLPIGRLAFATDQTYEPVEIAPDGSFSVRLQPARHRVEVTGMPVGYNLSSVRVGSSNQTTGVVTVGTGDISGVTISVAAPRGLAKVQGRVRPRAGQRPKKVRLTGPVFGGLEADVRSDGSFELPAVTPGRYTAAVVEGEGYDTVSVVVGWTDVLFQLNPRQP